MARLNQMKQLLPQLCAMALKPSVGRIEEWGLDLQRHKILVNRKQETSRASTLVATVASAKENHDLLLYWSGRGSDCGKYYDQTALSRQVQPVHSTGLWRNLWINWFQRFFSYSSSNVCYLIDFLKLDDWRHFWLREFQHRNLLDRK